MHGISSPPERALSSCAALCSRQPSTSFCLLKLNPNGWHKGKYKQRLEGDLNSEGAAYLSIDYMPQDGSGYVQTMTFTPLVATTIRVDNTLWG
jgi:hypothetical protein